MHAIVAVTARFIYLHTVRERDVKELASRYTICQKVKLNLQQGRFLQKRNSKRKFQSKKYPDIFLCPYLILVLLSLYDFVYYLEVGSAFPYLSVQGV